MSKTTYLITSEKFTGSVTIMFANDYCALYNDLESTLTLNQRKWFLSRLQQCEKEFIAILMQSGWFTIIGQKEEVTFEMFWNRYNEKDRSSKKKTLLKWNRLSREQQLLAYDYVNTYFKNIPSGIAKKYAETYLNSEIWNN